MALSWRSNPNGWTNIIGADGERFAYCIALDVRPKTRKPDLPVALYRKVAGPNVWTEPGRVGNEWHSRRVLGSFRTIEEAQAAAEVAEH